jgi:hypothetical protein
MVKLMTAQQFANKIEWEGGLMMATQEYGLSANDLKPNSDPKLYKAMIAYDAWLDEGQQLIQNVLNRLDKYDEE